MSQTQAMDVSVITGSSETMPEHQLSDNKDDLVSQPMSTSFTKGLLIQHRTTGTPFFPLEEEISLSVGVICMFFYNYDNSVSGIHNGTSYLQKLSTHNCSSHHLSEYCMHWGLLGCRPPGLVKGCSKTPKTQGPVATTYPYS